jgi:cobalt-zinc-cadmium efflux system outer membrane protein
MTNNLIRLATIKLAIDWLFNLKVRSLDYALLALSLCFTTGVNAGEPEFQTLDLHTAIMKSLEHNPALESVEYELRSADAYAQQAAVGEKPEVSFSMEDAFGSGDFSGLDSSQSTLSISWILERSLLARRVDTRISEKGAVYVKQEIKRYDISAATAHIFMTVLAFQEQSKVSAKAEESARRALRDVRKRTESGKAPIADLLRAEIELERRRLEIENITHELDVARRLLAAQWGATSLNFSTLSGSLMLNGAVLDFSEMEQRIQQSPRVRLFLTQERVKQSELALAEEEAKNRLRFKTGVRRIDQSDDYAVVFGLSIPFGGAKQNQALIAALSEEQAGFRADARAEKIKLSAKLYSLYEGYKHNVHLSDALEKMIIPRLEKALLETQKAYDVGRYSYREWSTVQQEVLAARLELIGSRLAAHSNAVELERLTGQPILTSISTDLEH